MPFDEAEVLGQLEKEADLGPDAAKLYLRILTEGSLPAGQGPPEVSTLVDRGMVILSGDNSRFIPVHPRLAIANRYRSWREAMIRDINERRMRVDKLILRLIPVYEAAEERRVKRGG